MPKTITIKNLIFILLIPIPIVIVSCFLFGKNSLDSELKLLSSSYVHLLENQINELRYENKQALYNAKNCQQIQKDLLFESILREMLIIENGKVICSSKRTAFEANIVENFLPQSGLKSGEYLFNFPDDDGPVESLLVIDTDKKKPSRSAISVIEQKYINAQLRLESDDRIETLTMKIGGKTYPTDTRIEHKTFTVLTKSNYLDVEVIVTPSIKLKREKFNLFFLIGLPISLTISIFLYLIQYWLTTRGTLIESLKKGLKNHELFLVYQPLVSSKTNQVLGVEALIRWESLKHGFVRPDIFIPIAEQHDFINTITDFVLKRALMDWKTVIHKTNLHISVNIPPSYLVDKKCLEAFQLLSEKFKKENLTLGIEITERQLLDETGRNILSDIRALGIEVSIDDFGTGFTALSLLQDIEFDYLKIDRCFVNTIGVESVNAPILNSIINLAHDLKVSIVAEGVETEQQLTYLTSQNVQLLQGYFLYKPMRLEAFKKTFIDKI